MCCYKVDLQLLHVFDDIYMYSVSFQSKFNYYVF